MNTCVGVGAKLLLLELLYAASCLSFHSLSGFSALDLVLFSGTNCDDPAAMLFVNNNFRVDHQVTGVSWNAQLAADSTAYAAVLANKDNCKLEHSTPQARGNAGENL